MAYLDTKCCECLIPSSCTNLDGNNTRLERFANFICLIGGFLGVCPDKYPILEFAVCIISAYFHGSPQVAVCLDKQGSLNAFIVSHCGSFQAWQIYFNHLIGPDNKFDQLSLYYCPACKFFAPTVALNVDHPSYSYKYLLDMGGDDDEFDDDFDDHPKRNDSQVDSQVMVQSQYGYDDPAYTCYGPDCDSEQCFCE